MRISVLTLDGVFDLGLSAVLDAFQTANELIELSDMAVPRFDVRIVGVRKKVTTSQGLTVPVHLWHGALDRNVPLAYARRLSREIPNATLHVCEFSGHDVGVDRGGEITSVLADASG